MVCVRGAAGQGLLEPLTGRALPKRKMLPEHVVEPPDEAGADRRKRLQINPLLRTRLDVGRIVQGGDKLILEGFRLTLPQVNPDLDPGQYALAPGRGRG